MVTHMCYLVNFLFVIPDSLKKGNIPDFYLVFLSKNHENLK